MTEISPHLWFDDQAEEAANLYTSIFEVSQMGASTKYVADTPSHKPKGSVMSIGFDLAGIHFVALNGGPEFSFNPSISFLVRCNIIHEVDVLWEALSDGGKVLMPLASYPFSERFGWVEDKFGVSWQVNYIGPQDISQKIIPKLMFTGKQCGRAEEAMNFYTRIFKNGKIGTIDRYGSDAAPDTEGQIQHGEFIIEGQEFAIMDSAHPHDFSFNEAISLIKRCRTQPEIDFYWEQLSADPSAEQCGWLRDKFGVSWQIVPFEVQKLLNDPDPFKAERVMSAILAMKKIDVEALYEAYDA